MTSGGDDQGYPGQSSGYPGASSHTSGSYPGGYAPQQSPYPPQQGYGQYAPPADPYAQQMAPSYEQQQAMQSRAAVPQAPVSIPVYNPNGYVLLTLTPKSKRRALFIGINYFGTSSELRGCIADVKNVHAWLVATYAFKEICILTDDCQDPRGMPTRQNIINGMK